MVDRKILESPYLLPAWRPFVTAVIDRQLPVIFYLDLERDAQPLYENEQNLRIVMLTGNRWDAHVQKFFATLREFAPGFDHAHGTLTGVATRQFSGLSTISTDGSRRQIFLRSMDAEAFQRLCTLEKIDGFLGVEQVDLVHFDRVEELIAERQASVADARDTVANGYSPDGRADGFTPF